MGCAIALGGDEGGKKEDANAQPFGADCARDSGRAGLDAEAEI